MDLTQFLAMTGAEFAFCEEKPKNIAWMACHFSPYGTGLSHMPQSLPPGSMLILNDRIPIHRHDPQRIALELTEKASQWECDSILLDFQRQNSVETAAVTEAVLQTATVPVGVSDGYAKEHDCPVFLPPPPLCEPLNAYLSAWQGREIWLEAALELTQITVTENSCTSLPLPYSPPEDAIFCDNSLCCSYRYTLRDNAATFTLWRTPHDLSDLLDHAAALGVVRSVGLYQQLKP